MDQPTSVKKSQEQDSVFEGNSVGRDVVYAPSQIENQTIIIQEVSRTEVTKRPLIYNSPYKGLDSFDVSDHDYFFGRDKLIADLKDKVTQSSLTIILGASGSGKSSVVSAGLIPKLKASLYQTFHGFVFTPAEDPFDSLYQCLKHKKGKFSESEAEIALEAKADTLTNVFRLKKDEEFWLIFVDQFEELFTRCNDSDTQKNFIAGLVQVAKSGNSSVKIVLAMRSNFIDQFSFYPDLVDIANESNIHLLTEMNQKELRQAIEAPAAKHGVVFQEGLVEQIIEDVERRKGYLPLLQYTLNLLWERESLSPDTNGQRKIDDQILNTETYAALNGVGGALQKHLNDIYDKLEENKQIITKQIFLKLVNTVDRKPRQANYGEFFGQSADTTLVKDILETFVNKRLLVISSEDTSLKLQVSNTKHLKQSATVELAHEILLSWEKLEGWLKQGKAAINLRNRLADRTNQWLKSRTENESRAEEELLRGSELTEIKEFRDKGTFQEIGGLNQQQEDFINTSAEWRDHEELAKETALRRERAMTRNLRWLVAGLVVMFLGTAGAARVASIQLQNVKVANQRRQEDLIRSAWISLKPSQKSPEECGTWLDYGLRDLYCNIKPFVDYRRLMTISGLPVFTQGPHTDSELNFEGGYEFGHYNPEFLQWVQNKVVIDPGDGIFKQQIQSAYDDKIRIVARAFYQTHEILFATPEEFQAFKKEYAVVQKQYQELLRTGKVNEGRFYNDPLEFEEIKSTYLVHIQNKSVSAGEVGFYLTEDCRWLADYLTTQNENAYQGDEKANYWYLANVSGGFWIRRSIDGTEKQFFEILTKLLEIYDSEWLSEQKLLDK